jgi:SAM-dependent methyltransferase
MNATIDTDPLSLLPGEAYLRAYHDRRPGRQSAGTELVRLPDGRTTYEVTADLVAGPGARGVLDLGCADGGLLDVLAGRGAQRLAGIDLSERELSLARQRPALAHADLRQGLAQALPWADDAFDAVAAHMSLMLMTDLDQVIAEVARVLAPGGVLVATLGAGPLPDGGVARFLTLAMKYLVVVPKEERIPRLGDRRARNRQELDALLIDSGFEPAVWEAHTLTRECEPEELFDEFRDSMYGMEKLGGAQIDALHAEFLDDARRQAADGGWSPGGMEINVLTAKLSVRERDDAGAEVGVGHVRVEGEHGALDAVVA